MAKVVKQMGDFLRSFTLVRPENEEVYCIAYGSNLNEARMRQRCPGAEVFGTSVIVGYRMLFKQSMTGAYATIEQDANSCVPVLIYRMTAADEARLDRFEGYPKYYYKREFFLPVWNLKGHRLKKRRTCIAYIMHETDYSESQARTTSACWTTVMTAGASIKKRWMQRSRTASDTSRRQPGSEHTKRSAAEHEQEVLHSLRQ